MQYHYLLQQAQDKGSLFPLSLTVVHSQPRLKLLHQKNKHFHVEIWTNDPQNKKRQPIQHYPEPSVLHQHSIENYFQSLFHLYKVDQKSAASRFQQIHDHP
ncbi:hypothetical protein D3C80_1966060 [compost metagenome]